MTTSVKNIIDGTEDIKDYLIRNRKFLIIVGIGIVIIFYAARNSRGGNK